MHQILFLGDPADVADLEADESPVEAFPCMSSQQFHREARAQLYALVMGTFLDEALDLEILERMLTEEGPCIYRLENLLLQRLGELDEGEAEALALEWCTCEEIEQLDLETNDLLGFLFLLVHFCQTAVNDDLSLYIYSDL